MAGKSLNFELDDGDSVTMRLSNSARISLTDITAATIGNLTEESEWGDNSNTATDSKLSGLHPWAGNSNTTTEANASVLHQWEDNSNSTTELGASVLRPWEDNSGTDKAETIPQNVVYQKRQPPSYKEHLKRHYEVDEIKDTENITKRIKLEPANTAKDGAILYSFIVPAVTSSSLTYGAVTSPCSKYGNSRNISQATSTQALFMPQTFMPYSTIQNYHQNASTQNSMQNTQNSMLNTTTQNSMLNTTTQNSMLNTTTQNSMLNTTTQNSMLNTTTQNSMLNTTTQNSMQSLSTQNPLQQYQTINPTLNSSVTIEQLTSFEQTSDKNYLPLANTPALIENKNIHNAKQDMNGRYYRQQTSIESSKLLKDDAVDTSNKLIIDESVSMPQCHTKPFPLKPELIQTVPTHSYQMPSLHDARDYWQASTIPSQQNYLQESVQTQRPLPQLQPAPTYLHMSDILQNKKEPEGYKPIQSPWQHVINPYQPNQTQPNLMQPKQHSEFKQEPATPIGKGLMTISNFDSPGIDSRFTESLSNLLGSPPPDSPLSKNPFLGDLQALLNRECKREIVPQSLFGMQVPNKQTTEKKTLNVFERERNLQERFTNLQSSHAEDIRQLSSMFRYQSALIETERFRTLHECQYPGSYKESVNHHYDNQLHKVMDRVERSVELLENSDKENRGNKITKIRPHLSKESVRLMEQWYQQNLNHPYPTNSAIEMLAQAGNIGIEQVKKWFANKRNRSANTRTLTEIAMQKRKLGQMSGKS